MSKRTRTISWMEGKIIEVLSKKRVITTNLALSTQDLQARLSQHTDPEAKSSKYCPKNSPWG